MKVNNGFVTNSSSTSFVVTSQNAVTKDKFIKVLGIKKDTLIYEMVSDLYDAVEENKELLPQGVDIRTYFAENRIYIQDEIDLVEIEKRYNAGERVYYGKLSDAGEQAATIFFSNESFVVIGSDFYFNARNSAY